MSGTQRQVVKVRIQLSATSTTELWLDLMPFLSTVGVTRVRGRTVLCEIGGTTFRCRVGIQTHAGDPEFPDIPTAITTGTGIGQVSTVVRNFVDFDPTVSTNGNITTKPGFRLGLFYSSTGATVARGEVIVELFVDA